MRGGKEKGNSCAYISIFAFFGRVTAPKHYLVIVMPDSDPGEGENYF